MKITTDNAKYDKLHAYLILEIMRRVKSNLEEAGIHGELLKKLTGDLAFSVCAIIDSSYEMEVDGNAVIPFLAFQESYDDPDRLIVNEDGSHMHEMVFLSLDHVFDEQP